MPIVLDHIFIVPMKMIPIAIGNDNFGPLGKSIACFSRIQETLTIIVEGLGIK